MSCKAAIHLICWYLEGKLSEDVEHEIQLHLEGCQQCRVVLEAATTTLDQFFSAPKAEELTSTTRAA